MGTITGLTAAAMLAIKNGAMASAEVVGDNLIITKHDGTTINAGNVRGPTGPAAIPAAACSYKQNGQIGLSANVSTQIILATAEFVQVGGFSLSGGKIKVPATGIYHISFIAGMVNPALESCSAQASGGSIVNGAEIGHSGSAGVGASSVGAGDVSLAANELVGLFISSGPANTTASDAFNRLSIHRVA
jgi:hypothetical protein